MPASRAPPARSAPTLGARLTTAPFVRPAVTAPHRLSALRAQQGHSTQTKVQRASMTAPRAILGTTHSNLVRRHASMVTPLDGQLSSLDFRKGPPSSRAALRYFMTMSGGPCAMTDSTRRTPSLHAGVSDFPVGSFSQARKPVDISLKEAALSG